MSRVLTFDKDSKRWMRQIRWKLREVISLVNLAAALICWRQTIFIYG
jgi:hypothetical protein